MSDRRSASPGPPAKRMCTRADEVLVDAFIDMRLVEQLPPPSVHAAMRTALVDVAVLEDVTARLARETMVPLGERTGALCMLIPTAQLPLAAKAWIVNSSSYREIHEGVQNMREVCRDSRETALAMTMPALVAAIVRDYGGSIGLLALLKPLDQTHDEVRELVARDTTSSTLRAWSRELLLDTSAAEAVISNIGMLNDPEPVAAALGEVLRAHAAAYTATIDEHEREIRLHRAHVDATKHRLVGMNTCIISLVRETRRLAKNRDAAA
jgi:hypothetical protein